MPTGLWRPVVLVSCVLLILVLPFFLFAEPIEAWYADFKTDPPGPALTSGIVVGLLAGDIFLPIPSTVIMPFAGAQLGIVLGALTSWFGLSLGCIVGFALAKWLGRPVARWFTKAEDLESMESASDRFGPLFLILARPIPVFAEASILLVGVNRLTWRRFLPPVLASNLVIAIGYAAFGNVADRYNWLPIAVIVSGAVPVLIAAVARHLFRQRHAAEAPAVKEDHL